LTACSLMKKRLLWKIILTSLEFWIQKLSRYKNHLEPKIISNWCPHIELNNRKYVRINRFLSWRRVWIKFQPYPKNDDFLFWFFQWKLSFWKSVRHGTLAWQNTKTFFLFFKTTCIVIMVPSEHFISLTFVSISTLCRKIHTK
jgi:hypothetical protein